MTTEGIERRVCAGREMPGGEKMARAPLSRIQVGAIALLSAFFVWEGPVASPVVAASAAPSRPTIDAGSVARVVGAMNPVLSGRERDRIGAAVMRYSAKYTLDPELVTAVLLVESGGRPWARSPMGAMGLMQVMPYMSAPLALAGNAATIETNVEAGCLILADNVRRLGEEDGVSAYFWGSDIRGVAYLQRVQAARERVRRSVDS